MVDTEATSKKSTLYDAAAASVTSVSSSLRHQSVVCRSVTSQCSVAPSPVSGSSRRHQSFSVSSLRHYPHLGDYAAAQNNATRQSMEVGFLS